MCLLKARSEDYAKSTGFLNVFRKIWGKNRRRPWMDGLAVPVGFLSVIFGILGKFWIYIDKKYLSTFFFFEMKKILEKSEKNILGIFQKIQKISMKSRKI